MDVELVRYYYTVVAGKFNSGFQKLEQKKRKIADEYLLVEDAVDEYVEKHPDLEFPVNLFLYDKNHLPIGSFIVEKRIEVSYFAEKIL